MYDIADYMQIFQNILGLEKEEDVRRADSEYTEGWDSYTHMELIVAIEEKFQVSFEGRDVLEFTSFEKGMDVLKRMGIFFVS